MATDEIKFSSRVKLNDGRTMPRVHLGVYNMSGQALTDAVHHALDIGYRGFDSAQMYHNERETGEAILSWLKEHPEVSREDIFYTSKLLNNDTYERCKDTIAHSIEQCGLGYIDLFLIHAPFGGPKARREAWRAIEDAIAAGTVRTGGVSNFGVRHMQQLLSSDEKLRFEPAVNQLEVHPFNTHADTTQWCQEHGLVVEAFCPLTRREKMGHPVIVNLSKKYQCTPAQLLLRWSLQHGFVPLPKSQNPARLLENSQVEGFNIYGDDMRTLDALDENYIVDWDPLDVA